MSPALCIFLEHGGAHQAETGDLTLVKQACDGHNSVASLDFPVDPYWLVSAKVRPYRDLGAEPAESPAFALTFQQHWCLGHEPGHSP